MNKKYSILLGIGALVVMVALNLGHAIDKYGILKGNLSFHVLAQDSSGSDSSGSGSSDGGSTIIDLDNYLPCVTKITADSSDKVFCSLITGYSYKETRYKTWTCEHYGIGGPCEHGTLYYKTDCNGYYLEYLYSNSDWSASCVLVL